MSDKDKKVLIVGLGLIGASYAEGLSKAGWEVGAVSRRASTIDYALAKGFISHGRASVDAEYVGQFDVVVCALYPKLFVEWIESWQGCLKSGAVLTDVTGVKGSVVPKICEILRSDVDFVPAHPMAGREVYGVENADCGIFRGANFIITPVERSSESGIAIVENIATALGFRKISRLSVERHDEMIGFLSQLTHCIAVALMDCKESSHLVDYTGDSFRDLTRIARINEDMWTELFLANKAELLSQMDLFLDKFSQLRSALASSDEQTLKEMMRLSSERRAYFDKR